MGSGRREPDPLAELMTITRYSQGGRPVSTAYDCRCGWHYEGVAGTSHREIAAVHAARAHGAEVSVSYGPPDRSGGVPLAEWERRNRPRESQGQLHRRLGMTR